MKRYILTVRPCMAGSGWWYWMVDEWNAADEVGRKWLGDGGMSGRTKSLASARRLGMMAKAKLEAKTEGE